MKLYKHQERALDLLADHDAFALFMEQGTDTTSYSWFVGDKTGKQEIHVI